MPFHPLSTWRAVCLVLAALASSAAPVRAAGPRPPAAGDLPGGSLTYDAVVSRIILEFSPAEFERHLREISGDKPAWIDRGPATIATRHTFPTFRSRPNARALDYIVQEIEQCGLMPRLHEYAGAIEGDTYANVVVEIPGEVRPETILVLCAHFDSRSPDGMVLAPGADDNGTGVAMLLEAARVLAGYRFENTIRIVFFSAEEIGRRGSRAYTDDLAAAGETIAAAFNFDMFGYDGDGDGLLNLHVGSMSASQALGRDFVDVRDLYGLAFSVRTFEVDTVPGYSDHQSFWAHGWPAILVIENMLSTDPAEKDVNPGYHTVNDRVAALDLGYAGEAARCGLGTLASLAVPLSSSWCRPAAPSWVTADASLDNLVRVDWETVPGATRYDVLRNEAGCGEGFSVVASTTDAFLDDGAVHGGITYRYRVRAFQDCPSELSPCGEAMVTGTCGLEPSFDGAARVDNEGAATCAMLIQWGPASARCPLGPAVTYNVYRSRDPWFLPSVRTLIAVGVDALEFRDGVNLLPDTEYWYTVRAEDGSGSGGGPARGGNEDGNLVRVNGLATGAVTTLFFDDMEGGPGGWTHGSLGCVDEWDIGQPTGVGRFDAAAAYSGTSIWGTDLGSIYEGDYPPNCSTWLESAAVDCSGASNVRVSFRRRLATENGRVDPARCIERLSGLELAGNQPGLSTGDFADTAWVLSYADMSLQTAGRSAVLRFDLNSNGSRQLGGWNIDDVRVFSAEQCTAGTPPCSGPPGGVGNTLTVTKIETRARLAWTDPADGETFRVYEGAERNLGDLAVVSSPWLDAVFFDDWGLSDGVPRYYGVRAANPCGEGPP